MISVLVPLAAALAAVFVVHQAYLIVGEKKMTDRTRYLTFVMFIALSHLLVWMGRTISLYYKLLTG